MIISIFGEDGSEIDCNGEIDVVKAGNPGTRTWEFWKESGKPNAINHLGVILHHPSHTRYTGIPGIPNKKPLLGESL